MRAIPHLVDAGWLSELLNPQSGPGELAIVDCRWKLGSPGAGALAYAEGHLPGAVFADVDRDLAGPPSAAAGRHPLPSPEAFRSFAERSGIGDRTRVVAYDDQGGALAARLWFLMGYFGHETCAVLDGGVQAWAAAGLALSKEVPAPAPAQFRPSVRSELVCGIDEVASLAVDPKAVVIDARAPERYRGEQEPVDARAGHIPGAVNLPFAGNLEAGRFAPPPALKQRLAAVGIGARPAAAYCGSGVTACHDLLAAAVAGLPIPKLYPGSWSQWASDGSRVAATGSTP